MSVCVFVLSWTLSHNGSAYWNLKGQYRTWSVYTVLNHKVIRIREHYLSYVYVPGWLIDRFIYTENTQRKKKTIQKYSEVTTIMMLLLKCITLAIWRGEGEMGDINGSEGLECNTSVWNFKLAIFIHSSRVWMKVLHVALSKEEASLLVGEHTWNKKTRAIKSK